MKLKNLTRTLTFKIIFAFLLILLTFGALVGCGKQIMKAEKVMASSSNQGFAGGYEVSSVDMAVNHDAGYAVPSEPAVYEVGESYGGDGVAYARTNTKMIAPYPEPMPPISDTEGEYSAERKVIKTASLGLEVDDYEAANIKVMNLAQKYGGFVADSNSYTDQKGKRSGHVYVRVPSLHFDAALIEASTVGEIKSQSVTGDDVTENYMDIQARLNNSQREEKQLHEILEKAEDVGDILQVEREISRVRGDVERYQGRLNYLDNHVSLSSINVEMHEPAPVVKSWGIWKAMKDSFNYSLATIRFLIRLLGFVLPLGILATIFTIIIVWRLRARRRKQLKKR